MTKTYAYTFDEAAPVLMQAIRFHYWQDPGEEIHGHETKCAFAAKMLRLTGALPAGMPVQRWDKCPGAAIVNQGNPAATYPPTSPAPRPRLQPTDPRGAAHVRDQPVHKKGSASSTGVL